MGNSHKRYSTHTHTYIDTHIHTQSLKCVTDKQLTFRKCKNLPQINKKNETSSLKKTKIWVIHTKKKPE